jgi:hypothetical protein
MKVLDDRTGGGSIRAMAEQIPVCSELQIQQGFLIYIHVYLTIRILSSNIYKIPFETDIAERNYCVSWGVSLLRSVFIMLESYQV